MRLVLAFFAVASITACSTSNPSCGDPNSPSCIVTSSLRFDRATNSCGDLPPASTVGGPSISANSEGCEQLRAGAPFEVNVTATGPVAKVNIGFGCGFITVPVVTDGSTPGKI